MFDIYKTKNVEIEAEHLDQDVYLHIPVRGSSVDNKVHIQGGNYLIKTSDGKIYPAKKEIFELLFERKDETNEI